MSSTFKAEHPQEFYNPGWHGDARSERVSLMANITTWRLASCALQLVIMGTTRAHQQLTLIIRSQHEDACHCAYRAARALRVDAFLFQIMRVVHDRKLEVDSLHTTPCAIQIIRLHELTVEEFHESALEMGNGISNQESQ
jgi:hypothetical protein